MAVEIADNFPSVAGALGSFGTAMGYDSLVAQGAPIQTPEVQSVTKALNNNMAETNLRRMCLDYDWNASGNLYKELKSSTTTLPGTPNVAEFTFKLGLKRDILDCYFRYIDGQIKVEAYNSTGGTLRGSVTTANTSGAYAATLQITGLTAGEEMVIRIYAADYDGVTPINIYQIRVMESYITSGSL